MAVDGVAPRAKMNQQRARRFRSAMEAKQKAEKAEKAGTILPKEAAFDSNCITPGTPFMDRLQAQLKYYINKKISEDSAWREITVILSGHDVPGEGEHKIMEYIRNSKAAPGYNPNVRHCLYGLDADLVMLGLLSHEPHFSLLREEVSFGRKPKRVTKTAGEQNFYLLHLSLIREYLGFEFQSLQETLSFPYDFERILDDFILICFFVGNDFLPHLPGLHINEGGLATLFEIYKTILPQCSGYLNDNGKLNVHHCQLFFAKLEELETEEFTNFKGDSSWLQGKKNSNSAPKKSKLLLSKKQEELFERIKFFLQQPRSSATLQLNWSKTPAGDREFLLQLISAVGLIHSIEAGEDYTMLEIGWDEDDDESDEESNEARARIIKKYEMADRQIIKSKKEELVDKQIAFEEAKTNWKKDYYREKLEFTADYEENVSRLVYSYVEGLQWVLFYYYHGVASWEWFFPYHYGPKISDLKSISKLEFNFELGDPFFPFEQLMAVLPPLSKQHVPPSLQDLMTDIHSPIIDFYPTSFKLDMNGKQAEWEAIVKIPFIDEKRLLKAVRGRQKMLTADERRRNTRGTDFLFVHSRGPIATHYPSPLPSVFPDIFACYCVMNVFRTIPKPPGVAINKLNENALLGKNLMPGFPSLYTLQFTSSLGHHGVNVFNSDSKNPSHILTLENSLDETPEEKAMKLIGSTIYSDWPFLIESHVLQVADEFFVYEKKRVNEKESIIKTPHTEQTLVRFAQSVERTEKFYSKRFGVIIGVVDMVAKIESLIGMQLLADGSVVKEFKVLSEFDTPIQLLVLDDHHDPRFDERPRPPIHKEFPEGSIAFFLSPKLYGTLCEVSHSGADSNDSVTLKVNLPSSPEFQTENQMPSKIAKNERDILQYYPGWQIAKRLRLSAYTLSRIASNFQITLQESHQKLNIGLCLKFESKGLKVLGYTRKGEKGWEYSQKALDLIEDYRRTFPMILEKIERGGNTDFFLDIDFFPSDTKDAVVQVQKWLAQKGIKQLLAVPLNSVSLTKETVAEIESNVEEYNQLLTLQDFEPVLIKSVPRKNILKPSHSIFRLTHQTFELGDRVISTVDFGNVPIAAKGTVVGMEKDKLDICWDFPFMYATTLDGLCGSPRGSSVEKTTVLNLTNVQPPYALGKKLQIPKVKQKVVPPPRPTSNRWDKGAPKPIASEQLQMESMLKTMLHINPANNLGMYDTPHAYQVGPSGTWQPPVMISAPHFMDPHAPAFVPQGPTSYDSSWRPPVPLASSGPTGTYDEMANQLMSILHAHPQTDTANPSHSNEGQNEKNLRGRGNRGRGRTAKNQNPRSQDSRPDSGAKSDSNPRKFTLKKRGEQ